MAVLSLPSRGAWIEMTMVMPVAPAYQSLPSRGAWIEIELYAADAGAGPVAPLAGSVDRNESLRDQLNEALESLPSRGAWIEMRHLTGSISTPLGRSPRGERG